MSLLPGQILPATVPLGKLNEDGSITIDHNWWLLLYNLCLKILGTSAGPPSNPLTDIQSADIDALTADTALLRRLLANVTILAQEAPQDPFTQSQTLPLVLLEDPIIPGGLTGFANPSATIGLSAVNGVASTAMRSDSAPPLSQAIGPIWTGTHTYQPASGNAITFAVGATAATSLLVPAAQTTLYSLLGSSHAGPGIQARWDGGTTNRYLAFGTYDNLGTWAATQTLQNGAVTFSGNVSVNNVTPPAQVTGFGTPTGTGVIANFTGSANTSLANVSQLVAQIIKDLKAFGLYGS